MYVLLEHIGGAVFSHYKAFGKEIVLKALGRYIYIYVYTCMYTYMYIVYIYTYMYIYVYTYIYIYMFNIMYLRTF
jgi:hypothetical protein